MERQPAWFPLPSAACIGLACAIAVGPVVFPSRASADAIKPAACDPISAASTAVGSKPDDVPWTVTELPDVDGDGTNDVAVNAVVLRRLRGPACFEPLYKEARLGKFVRVLPTPRVGKRDFEVVAFGLSDGSPFGKLRVTWHDGKYMARQVVECSVEITDFQRDRSVTKRLPNSECEKFLDRNPEEEAAFEVREAKAEAERQAQREKEEVAEEARQTARRVAAARASLPGLFATCTANKRKVEAIRIRGIRAQRSRDWQGAQVAEADLMAINPKWSETLGRLREAVSIVTGDEGPEFVRLVRQVHDRCSCDASRSGRCR